MLSAGAEQSMSAFTCLVGRDSSACSTRSAGSPGSGCLGCAMRGGPLDPRTFPPEEGHEVLAIACHPRD